MLAQHSEVVRVAEQQAVQLRADAEEDWSAAWETDAFIDSRMASLSRYCKDREPGEAARARLAERSGLDALCSGSTPPVKPRLPSAPIRSTPRLSAQPQLAHGS